LVHHWNGQAHGSGKQIAKKSFGQKYLLLELTGESSCQELFTIYNKQIPHYRAFESSFKTFQTLSPQLIDNGSTEGLCHSLQARYIH